jgi:hypothetical protein
MKPTIDQMREHVMTMSRTMDIVVIWCERPSRAVAMREFEEVHIPRIKSTTTYAIAMHEMGHLFGRHQQSKRTLVRERWAWEWARKNALIWTVGMERCARNSLGWYARRSLNAS